MTIRAYEQQQQPAESKKPTTKKKVEESDDMNVTPVSPEKEEDWMPMGPGTYGSKVGRPKRKPAALLQSSKLKILRCLQR